MTVKLLGPAVAPGDGTHTASYAVFNRHKALASGLMTELRVGVDASVNLKLAIYSDAAGSPGELLESKVVTLPAGYPSISTGWNTQITKDAYYWLALNSSAKHVWYAASGGTCKKKAANYGGWTWPDPWANGAYSDTADQLYVEGWGVILETPTVQTQDADNITHEGAKLHGTLTNDGGEACDVRFQYGETTDYGTDTEWQPGKVSEDTFEQLIAGLDSEKTYHFRAQARNAAGTASGDDKEFQTTAVPPEAGEYRKITITHPALKTVRVIKAGQEQTKYDNLSNLDEGFIHGELQLPVEVPADVEVTTLADQVYKFSIPKAS